MLMYTVECVQEKGTAKIQNHSKPENLMVSPHFASNHLRIYNQLAPTTVPSFSGKNMATTIAVNSSQNVQHWMEIQ